MKFVDAAKNTMLGALTIDRLSAHTGVPDNTGSLEVSGGSYARLTVVFAAASTGSRAMSTSNPAFNIPAATTVAFIGFWSNTGPTFHGYAPVNGSTILGVATVLNAGDVFTNYAHGLVNGDQILFKSILGAAIPTGISAGVLYFVVGVTTNTFQVAATSGGAAIAISSDDEVEWTRVLPEAFVSAGTFTVSSATVDLNG